MGRILRTGDKRRLRYTKLTWYEWSRLPMFMTMLGHTSVHSVQIGKDFHGGNGCCSHHETLKDDLIAVMGLLWVMWWYVNKHTPMRATLNFPLELAKCAKRIAATTKCVHNTLFPPRENKHFSITTRLLRTNFMKNIECIISIWILDLPSW